MGEPITGVVGILTDDRGNVMATACDFDRDRPGGFDLYEAQRLRASRRLASTAFVVLCHPHIAEVVPSHRAEQIILSLCDKKGWKQTFMEAAAPTEAGGTGEGEP